MLVVKEVASAEGDHMGNPGVAGQNESESEANRRAGLGWTEGAAVAACSRLHCRMFMPNEHSA